MGFLCVLKMYYVRLYIVEKKGFGMAPRRCGIRSKSQPLLQKTCLSYTFETLVACVGLCLHMHTVACVRRQWLAYAGSNPRTQAEGYFG